MRKYWISLLVIVAIGAISVWGIRHFFTSLKEIDLQRGKDNLSVQADTLTKFKRSQIDNLLVLAQNHKDSTNWQQAIEAFEKAIEIGGDGILQQEVDTLQREIEFCRAKLQVVDVDLIYTSPRQIGDVMTIAFDTSGKRLVSGGTDRAINLWSVQSDGRLRNIRTIGRHDEVIYAVCFSPNGRYLASRDKGNDIKLWSTENYQNIKSIPDANDTWSFENGFGFSPNGSLLVSGNGFAVSQGNWRGEIKLWRISGQSVALDTSLRDSFRVLSIAFSPDGKFLLSGNYNGTITIRSFDNYTVQKTVKATSEVYVLAVSPDGSMFAGGGNGDRIKLWTLPDCKPIGTYNLGGNTNSIHFSPDGKLLACGAGTNIEIWSIGSGQLIKTLRGHTDYIWSVTFAPDGKYLASGSGRRSGNGGEERTIKIWGPFQ